MDGDEIRWRPPVILLIPVLLCSIFIFYVDVFQLTTFQLSTTFKLPPPRFVGYVDSSLSNDFLVKTEGCRIPYMDPFDPTVVQFITKEHKVVCNKNKPSLINSNLTHLYMLDTSLQAYKIKHPSALRCCYSVFKRTIPGAKQGDNKIVYKKCIPFNKTVEVKEEFVRVKCSYEESLIYTDFFSFVPIKIDLKKKTFRKNDSRMNVLIIGLDAVSRVNLHRQMPKTTQALKDIEAIEFLGYNKVADNTFPNVIPILTGLSEKELINQCWHQVTEKFDNCSFIWKNFSQHNFATAFGEDSAWMGMFNYAKMGFSNQPTDYFWDPFDYQSEKEIGNQHRMNVYQCIGSRDVYTVLLDYIMNFAKSMHQYNVPYFGFFWGSSLSHDFLNKPKLGDAYYAHFLKNLVTSDILKNTVLIFISDHGIRWGSIRATYQGRLEERLPFLFIVLPSDYREVYYVAFNNLKRNTRRLTTPFDLHETVTDLMNPYALTQDLINSRILKRHGNERAYSLFEPIPTNRTCTSAHIASHWCTCQESIDMDRNSSTVIENVNFAIDYINEKLEGYAECAKLILSEVLNAREHSSKHQLLNEKTYSLDYTVVFKTVPGEGIFEATLRKHINKHTHNYYFNVTGTISRINLYGKQSLCMTEFHLKLYCYCI